MKPSNLPDKCPSCGASISYYEWHGKHAHGWDIESTRYTCWSRMHYNGGKGEVKELCPKSSESERKKRRFEAINAVVAKALREVDCTEEECLAFAHEMDSQRFVASDRRTGIWRLLSFVGGR